MCVVDPEVRQHWQTNDKRKRHREAAGEYVRKVKPKLVIGSPGCTMFRSLQNMNKKYWSPEKKVKYMEAVEHIKFVVKLYRKQAEGGRWFLHEHPAGASSWDLEEMAKLAKEVDVKIKIADQCMYGLKTWSKDKKIQDMAAKKSTKFMTNCEALAVELSERCSKKHKHQELTGGRAKEAAIYPEGLCRAICVGLSIAIAEKAANVMHLLSVKHTDQVQVVKEDKLVEQEEDAEEMAMTWDDVTGV